MESVLNLIRMLRQLTQPDALNTLAGSMGNGLYVLLFAIIFAETGLVVTPFLPGDSLLFAVGAVAATPGSPVSLPLVAALLIVGAIVGDAVNYAAGFYLGPKVFHREDSWLLNRKHLLEAQRFYERYGGKTIILARFIPIIRTFAPFVAGIGRMSYFRFAVYNALGGILWVLICLLAGYWFGGRAFVQKNFELVLVAIIAISLLPAVIELARGWLAAKKGRSGLLEATTPGDRTADLDLDGPAPDRNGHPPGPGGRSVEQQAAEPVREASGSLSEIPPSDDP